MNKSSAWNTSYLPEIDGLRAFSIIFVIAYHAFPDLLKSGYIGVDIFFVISGFLITNYIIKNLEKKAAKKSPTAPFTTSTLQQEASRKLGFSVNQTMMVAQKLYEQGKITYMRTDSVNLSQMHWMQLKIKLLNCMVRSIPKEEHIQVKLRARKRLMRL